jgi:uncharacterized damage-inducible protein DinB
MTNLAVGLYEYNVWANKQIFNRLKDLPSEVYRQEIKSVFPSIASTLAHVYLSDLGWFEVFSGVDIQEAMGKASKMQAEIEAQSLEEMEILFTELGEQYGVLLSKQENLERKLVIPNPSGDFMHTSVIDLIPHVANHGTYHRGNVTAMLHQLEYASVMTDYGMYLYLKQKE